MSADNYFITDQNALYFVTFTVTGLGCTIPQAAGVKNKRGKAPALNSVVRKGCDK